MVAPPKPAPTVESDSYQLLLRRIRTALWFVLAGTLLFATLQMILYPEARWIALLPLLAQTLLVLGVLLRLPRHGRDAIPSAMLCIGLAFAVASLFGLWTKDIHVTAILVVTFTSLTATLVPWGATAQSIVVALATTALAFTSYELGGLTFPLASALAVALLMSIYVAYEHRAARRGETRDEQQRKRTEEALHLLESAVEQADDAVLIMTPDIEFPGPKVLYVNPAFTRMSGFTADEASERPLRALFGPGTDSTTIGRVREALINPEPAIGEGTFHRKDGRPYTAEWHTAAVRSAAGEITHWVTINRDVSERNRSETERALLAEKLYASEQEQAQFSAALARVGESMISSLDTPVLLEKLCELTTDLLGCDCSHVFLWRPEERVYVPLYGYGDVPELWESFRLLKIPPSAISALVERLTRDDVAHVDADADTAETKLFAQHGFKETMCVGLRRGDEVIGFYSAHYHGRSERFSARQVQLAKGIAHLASLALDNARLVEELERASRIKSDFVATMSHELRTPLNIVMGYQDLLLDDTFGPLNDEQRESLSTAQRRARDLLNLINATLDISRLDQHTIPMDIREIGVDELLQQVNKEIAEVTVKDGVLFTCRAPADEVRLITDPTKVKIIVKNLIDNAIKFTDAGYVELSAEPSGYGVELKVSDSGIGVAADVQEAIFEPFRQVDASSTSRFGGVGLGLYIVRRMVEMLNGSIALESELGQGSTFRVWLPRDLRERESNAPQARYPFGPEAISNGEA